MTGLTTYDQYGDEAHQRRANRADFEGLPLNAVVVTEFEHHIYAPDQAKVFLTSLPVTEALAVLDLYGLRSLIENTLFRELKQGWFISRFPKKTANAARSHVFLTLTTFNLTNAYRTEAGQALARRGIRRQRQDAHYVLVFAGESYAIFDVEEIFIWLGRPPELCCR